MGGGEDKVTQPDEPSNNQTMPSISQLHSADPSLFEKFILIISNVNRVKKHLNDNKQLQHDNPTHEDSVSLDEEEDTAPDCLAFDLLAEILHTEVREPDELQPPSPHTSTQPAPSAPLIPGNNANIQLDMTTHNATD